MVGFLVCVLVIYACIKCIESNMAGFIGGILCNSAFRCIFVCSVVTRGGVTWGLYFLMMFTGQVVHWYQVIAFIQINDIRTEIHRWFGIIWVLMSVQIKMIKLRGLFRSDLRGISQYGCVYWIFSSFKSNFSYFYHNWCELAHETSQDGVSDSEVILGEDIIGHW